MFDSLLNYLDKFGSEVLVIQAGFLVIVSTLFLWLWFSNRRKYHNLKHAIPANVVKSYLDSIIQNSTALKSSLFRGGGLEVGAGGVPSVMPLANLMGGDQLAMSGAPSTALLEELNQRKAQIASLEAQLAASQSAQKEFENKFNQSQKLLAIAEARIKELEALLAQTRGGGGDESLKAELAMITKERDEIRDRLKEFEIISDDLANLKRLQQENEQLKRSLAAQGGSIPQAKAEPTYEEKSPRADVADFLENLGSTQTDSDDTNALEDFLSAPTPDAPSEEVAAKAPRDKNSPPEREMSEDNLPESSLSDNDQSAAPEEEAFPEETLSAMDSEKPEDQTKKKADKTSEDLLSEFEKMLG